MVTVAQDAKAAEKAAKKAKAAAKEAGRRAQESAGPSDKKQKAKDEAEAKKVCTQPLYTSHHLLLQPRQWLHHGYSP